MTSKHQEEPLLISLDEAAAYLGIPRSTLHSWAWAGRVPCVRLGRRRLFRKTDLRAWVERHVEPARRGGPLKQAERGGLTGRRALRRVPAASDARPKRR